MIATLEPTAGPNPTKLDSFTRAYIRTALWSSTGYPHGECPCCGRVAVLDKLPESEFEQQLMCDAPGCGVREADPDPFDGFADESDIAPETLAEMVKDCADFQSKHGDIIRAAIATGEVRCGPDFDAWGHAGHDFWLTRCRHGAGFWDGDWPEPMAEALTEAARAFGEVDLYMGDDGMIYQSGTERLLQPKPTKGGIVAALLAKGYSPEHGPFPPSLREVQAATVFTLADDEFANHLIHDTDCGGAWNDAAQIEAATQGGAQ